MHTVALQLAPVLAAEKSKVPFYIAGGALVLWALLVSLGLGLRKPDFPGSLGGQRAVSAITAVLVLAAVSTAVLTSGVPPKSAQAATPTTTNPLPSVPAPTPTPTTATPTTPTPTTAAPTKTTTHPTPTHTAPTATTAPVPVGVLTELKLEADPTGLLAFNTKQLSAKPGNVAISFVNRSPVEHNVTIVQGTTVLGSTPTFAGGARTVTVKLKPGTYTFYCSVPGHRQAGMEGTLVVK
jgi:plastocyanin